MKLINLDYETMDKKEGKSLFPIQQNDEDREVFAETGGLYGPWPSPEKHNVFCLKKDHKKIIYNNTPNTWEFYNLENDPEEKHNIFDENSKLINEYKEKLINHFDKLA